MTQGKLSLANKSNSGSTSGQALVSPTPPSYEEATAGVRHFDDPAFGYSRYCGSFHILTQCDGIFLVLNSFYNTKSVVMCLGITVAVCLVVTIFSFQTKIDVTSYQGVLFIFCMVMFISGLVLAFVLPFHYVPWLDATYAALGAILFTMFLAFDTQLLMGNKRYAMSPEEYVFATLNIYLDIIYIFSFFLQIFGTKQE
ncbi:Protein lifeguard 2 [Collichthys lucidus]|uniref:Protein lifeguard 2 n=1 Tax=Collichthys lucidus TaxID=240159 RepID=A0A4U5UR97_COLLU|nr:Protein lifeguard 2 [Collichthys lucidus]